MHRLCALVCLAAWIAMASEHRGQVMFRGLPVPGAVVTVDGSEITAVTDEEGLYSFADLTDGVRSVSVAMFGFVPVTRDVVVGPDVAATKWELTMLPLERVRTEMAPARLTPVVSRAVETAPEEDAEERAADGFVINGSVNNGAASPFSQRMAFGNNRGGGRSLYNGGIGVMLGNSALDARPFSLTGQHMPKAGYNRTTGMVSLGGPLQIPHLLKNGPNFFVGYQWTRSSDAVTTPALMPGPEERNGVFQKPVLDPLTGSPFAGNVIPPSRISPQARALLDLYPIPNFDGGAGYNFQIPILNISHQDALQSRLMRPLGRSDQVYGHFNLQSTRADQPSLFGFLDTTDVLGINAAANWWHRFSQRWSLTMGMEFSRLATRVTPYFANRENVSGQSGILGNNQDPMNWGPPSLHFSGGIAGLTDAQSSFNRNQTSGLSGSAQWNRGAHNVTFGGGFRRQAFHYLSQQDPRGTFTFTDAGTGSDFANFLLGVPAASSIAFGNADKYLRQSGYDAYIADDWRLNSQVTLNAGVRWEYGSPVAEQYGRLVNLDIASGFASVSPVVASSGVSLLRPYTRGFAPRVGVAWRPLAGSSLIVRAGYGTYYDTSVYQAIAMRMAQQPPLSKAFSVQNSPENPLTLANGFSGPQSMAGNTFAIDPNFRPGYAQNWQFSVQNDLPGSLQMTATYLGIKGTHAMQAFLPNTFPDGSADACAACPTGFVYVTSNGNSSREAGQLQLRRRLRSGLTASVQYTFSKSIDNAAALGGPGSGNSVSGNLAIAQNWLDLQAERGLSAFDQRHVLSLQTQFTTGMGLGGGTLLNGWRGGLFKEWTVATQITAGSGLPQTPIYLAPVQGTGVTGTIRPDYTGAPLYGAATGHFLNPAAYAVPEPGQWGNAGRNSIRGPAQFTLNASLGRTFRLTDRFNLDLRADVVNALNRVNFTSWNTTVNSAQFGLPSAANAMRSVQTTLRLRF